MAEKVYQKFSVSTGGRTRSNGLNLQHWRFKLDIKKNILTIRLDKLWNKLPLESVKSPSLEVFKNRLDKHLSGIVWFHMFLP